MAKLKHTLEHMASLSIATAAQLLSPRLADSLGAGLGNITYRLLLSRRRIAAENIRKSVVGENLSDSEIEALVKKVFQNIGRTLVEFSRFGKLKKSGAEKILMSDSAGLLKKMHDGGKGCIIVTAHFGNWELLGCWFAVMGYPMHYLVTSQHNAYVNQMLTQWRKEMGVGIINLEHNVRSVFKVLRANEIAGLVADQHAPSGIPIIFMGRTAMAAKGPALFSMRTGAPICPYLMRREKHDRHVLMAGEPIYPPNSGDYEKDMRTITEKYTQFFEDWIRKYPDQWMWTHRRWKYQDV